MKKLFFAIYLTVLASSLLQAQTNKAVKTAQSLISFKLKNNSLLPAKVTMITYRPDETGNGTRGFMMVPYCSKSFSFPIGTKIYLANNNQVNTVMSGESITSQQPFLEVKATDADKVFPIK